MQFSKIESLFLYLSVYIISSISLTFCAKANRKIEKFIFYFVAVFAVVTIATVRYNVGSDYLTYVQIYKNSAEESFFSWITKFDFSSTPLAVYVYAKVANFFNSEKLFFFLFAVSIYIPVSFVILKHKESASVFLMSFAFLTTTYTIGFNIMKQIVACAIVLYAYNFVLKKKLFKFILFVFIGACFHPTALIVLPLYFCNTTRDSSKKTNIRMSIIGLIYIVVCFSYRFILEALGGRFEDYITDGVKGNNFSFILSCLWLFVIIIFRKKLLKSNADNLFYIFVFVVSVIFEGLGYISPFIKRVALYFSLVLIIIVPQLAEIFEEKNRVFIRAALFIVYSLLFVLEFYILGHSNVIPYITW